MEYFNENSVIQPCFGGVILSDVTHRQFPTVNNMFATKNHVFFTRQNHTIADVNEACLHNFSYAKKSDAIGDTFAKLCDDKSQILKVFSNDQLIFKNQRLQVFEEIADLVNGNCIHTLTYKLPWYSPTQELLGIFGYAVSLNNRSFKEIAEDVARFSEFLLSDKHLPMLKKIECNEEEQFFSPREVDVARLLVRGKTAREIAEILNLSSRTVEAHLNNMKRKLNVNKKSQLIEKIIDWVK